MHRHPKHPGWIVAEELYTDTDQPTDRLIASRSDAITSVRDYEDDTIMIWTNVDGGTLVAGDLDELLDLIAPFDPIPPLPLHVLATGKQRRMALARITKEAA